MTVRVFCVFVLSCLALLSACSGDTPATSGLVVSVESDLSVPKDIDRMEWEASQGKRMLVDRDKQVIGTGRLPLPHEFRIPYPGNKMPVTIRVIAYKGSRQRIERTASTSIPSTRWAVLHMGIDFLCDATLDQGASCQEGSTCIGGTCSKPDLDESDLPSYEPAADSGNDKQSVKACFDVASCFNGANPSKLGDDCTIDVNTEVKAEQVNVGLALATGGDGVCDPSACYIPLDKGPEGWSLTRGRIALPAAVCRRRASGQDLDVVISSACAAKTSALPVCAAASNSNGGEGTQDRTLTASIMPTEFVSNACGGQIGRPCGMCGTQLRECNAADHTWSDYAECMKEGECKPDMTEPCQRNGTRACGGDCHWGECQGQTCEGQATRACGNCGTQRRACDNGVWGAWSECSDQGACALNTTQGCGSKGTQACGGSCAWGACGEQTCEGAPSEACGHCGTHSRSCDADNGQWSAFGTCADEGECAPDAVQGCGHGGMQTCGGNCHWDETCTGQSCEGQSTQACGNCGTQRRSCDANSGTWSDWGPCNNEGSCRPDATRGCGSNGTQFCAGNCQWESTCSGQSCAGSNQQTCGNCGTQTRTCNSNTGESSDWSACSEQGECRPNAVQSCGSGGTRVCTTSCRWPSECRDQECDGAASETCGNCGVRTRSCDPSTGRYSSWSACMDQGECKAQSHEMCGLQGSRVCNDDCKWSNECGGQICLEPETQKCGNCGMETSTCNPNTGHATWSTCSGEGKCSSGQQQECGSMGMRVCGDDCQWPSACMKQVCPGTPPTRDCGSKCGVQTSRCDTDTATWHFVEECSNEKACAKGDKRMCGENGNGRQTCSDSCVWGECIPICDAPQMRACGICGSGMQVSMCDPSTGAVTWSECMAATGCTPGAMRACGPNKLGEQRCGQDCKWPEACECAGNPLMGICPMCGNFSSTCNKKTGEWDNTCSGGGACEPGATQACGTEGQGLQTCSEGCKWNSDCQCTGEPAAMSCGACGTPTTTCNTKTGAWQTTCTGGGACTPGMTRDCGDKGQGKQTCGMDCQYSGACECDPATKPSGACGTCNTGKYDSTCSSSGSWTMTCVGGDVDTQSDPKHCGSCNVDCEGQKCVAGKCDIPCDSPRMMCGTECIDLGTDKHCTSCAACASGETCESIGDGELGCRKPTPVCGSSEVLCGEKCYALGTNDHCNSCAACGSDQTCRSTSSGNQCVTRQAPDAGAPRVDAGSSCAPIVEKRCNGVCVRIDTEEHCNGCEGCAAGETCNPVLDGAYVCSTPRPPQPMCKSDEQLCDGQCFPLISNAHCGTCLKQCPGSTACMVANGEYVCGTVIH